MISIRQDGEERTLSFEEFTRAIQEGEVTADTAVRSDVLTAGQWKPAGELRFFRAWAPKEAKAGGEEPFDTSEPWSEADEEDQPTSESVSISEPDPTASRRDPPSGRESTPSSAVPPRPQDVLPPFPPADDKPEGGSPGAQHPGGPVPWEQADRIGFGTGLYATLWLAFRNTEEFFRRITWSQTLLPALLFGLALFAFSNLIDGIYGYILVSHFGEALREMQGAFPAVFEEELLASPGNIFLSRGAVVLFYPVLVFVWSALAHLLLRAFERPSRTYYTTFRMANYAMAPLILTIVPVCGNIVAWVWVLALMVRGMARVHRVGTAPAAFAVLLPFILPVCLAATSLGQPMMQIVSGSAGGF